MISNIKQQSSNDIINNNQKHTDDIITNNIEENNQIKYIPFKSKTKLNFLPSKNERLGEILHRPAAIKEWKNSVYSYNKSYMKTLPSLDNTLERLIKSYFHFTSNKTTARSKRMRSLRRKLTTKRLFVSKPELKQTNDKITVTIYTFNREKQFLLKKLFFHNRRRSYLDLWQNNLSLINNRSQTYDPTKHWDQSYNLAKLTKTTGLSKKEHLYKNPRILNRKVNRLITHIIRRNNIAFNEVSSNLVTKKDKNKFLSKLYIKLYSKIMRNVTKPKTNFSLDEPNNTFYYMANKWNLASYAKKRKRLFKKPIQTKKTTWYKRKKMKNHVLKSPGLSKKQKAKLTKRIIPYTGIKLNNEMNFLSFRLDLNNKKFAYARKLFYYYFLKYALSIFNVKVYAFKKSNVPTQNTMQKIIQTSALLNLEKQIKIERKGKRNKNSKFIYNVNKSLLSLYKTPKSLTSKGTKLNLYFYSIKTKAKAVSLIKKTRTNKDVSNFLYKTKPVVVSINLLNSTNNLDYVLSNVNFIVSQFLNKILTKSYILEKERKLNLIYQKFCKKHYLKFLSKLWKNEALFSANYTRFMVNKFKFSKFLPNLKLLISKLYNKKTELNIVNLKYSHLNTDIFTDIITLKLRKRLNLLSVLKKAMSLVKKPQGYLDNTKLNVDYDINKIKSLNQYKSWKFKNLNKTNELNILSLQDILDRLYPRNMVTGNNQLISHLISKKNEEMSNRQKQLYPDYLNSYNNISKLKIFNPVQTKIKNILNTIKYKTVSGARLEGAGRLTRRYKAERSIFKYRHKGSLKNIDYARKIEFSNKTIPTAILRNQVKANSQYSFNHSNRRIGAFGIKGWISGY